MNKLAGQPQTIKKINSDLIFQLIFEYGPISKPELAERASLSLPTVNNIVDILEKNGEVRSDGQSTERSLGRKATLYVTNGKFGNFLSLFFLRDHYICTVSDVVGKIIWRDEIPLSIGSGQEAVNETILAIKELESHAKEEVKAIGLGVPGIVGSDGVIHSITQIEGWENLPLRDIIKSKIKIDTFAENDVKLMTVGYYYRHLKNLYQNVVYIFVGRGLGAGIILNGKLYTGTDGFAGEFAYMMAKSDLMPPYASYVDKGGYMETDIRNVTVRRSKVDDLNRKILFVVTNFISILNPQAIVFGGDFVNTEQIRYVENNIGQFIPQKYIPEFYYDDMSESGTDGIFRLCFANTSIYKHMRLVEEVGL